MLELEDRNHEIIRNQCPRYQETGSVEAAVGGGEQGGGKRGREGGGVGVPERMRVTENDQAEGEAVMLKY